MSNATVGTKERKARAKRAANRPETMEDISLGGLIPGTPIEPARIDVEAAKKKSTPAKGKPAKGKPSLDPEPESPAPKRIRKPKPDPTPKAPPEAPDPAQDTPSGDNDDNDRGIVDGDDEGPEAAPIENPEGGPEAPDPDPATEATDPPPATTPEAPGAWGPPTSHLATYDPREPGEVEIDLSEGADEVIEVGPLSDDEEREYQECIGIVSRSYAEQGEALIRIRDKKLFRRSHPTWRGFVVETFNVTFRWAEMLMSAAVEVKRLESAGVPKADLPNSLRGARTLVSVPPEERESVLRAANEAARANGKAAASGEDIAHAAGKRGRPAGSTNKANGEVIHPDSVEPREVARARANGTIPEGATIEITQVGADETEAETNPTPDEVFDRAKYLDGFPIREHLGKTPLLIFDHEAIVYRTIEDERKRFILGVTGPAIEAERRAIHRIGPYSARIQRALRTPDPSQWVLCESCQGAGEVEIVGKKTGCNDCFENGFRIPG